MLSSIKNVIFDLGGVILDLDRQRCIDSFAKIGFPQASDLISCYHPVEFFERLERGEITVDEWCDIIRSKGEGDMSNEEICQAYSNFIVGLPVYKLRLLESLRNRGIKVYALSNMNPAVMGRIKELFAADGKCMEEYFDKLYLSYEMGCLKPKPEIYEKLISDSGIVPSETLFIDDSDLNIVAGREFGLNVYLAKPFEDFSHLFEK